MIRDASLALSQLFSPEFRRVLFKCLAVALLLLVVAGFGLDRALAYFVDTHYGWLDTTIAVVAALGLVVAAVFLVPPVTILVAGVFIDEIAALVETRYYPGDAPGRPLPVLQALWLSVVFFAVVLAVNLVALLLLLLPGINLVAFFIAKAYLLSREYFELAAMRFRTAEEAKALRRAHAGRIFVAGLIIAILVSIPVLNLLTPLFGTAFMVHLHKRLSGSSPETARGSAVPKGR
jgi:CysZ protein